MPIAPFCPGSSKRNLAVSAVVPTVQPVTRDGRDLSIASTAKVYTSAQQLRSPALPQLTSAQSLGPIVASVRASGIPESGVAESGAARSFLASLTLGASAIAVSKPVSAAP